MTYSVKEIYFTLQGEGRQAGRAAVFCRFAGCNLWSGLERDRTEAICRFCDTDFVGIDGPGGGAFNDPEHLTDVISRTWPATARTDRFVVLTGGEPMLQLDEPLIEALHDRAFEIALETNGTRAVPNGVDWICVSPKSGAPLVQKSGDELKLVYPQADFSPKQFEKLDFKHFLLQPMDGPDRLTNTERTISYCLAHPHWKLSLQTHKYLRLP